MLTSSSQTTQRPRPHRPAQRNHYSALIAIQTRRGDDQEEDRIPHRARLPRALGRCPGPKLQVPGLMPYVFVFGLFICFVSSTRHRRLAIDHGTGWVCSAWHGIIGGPTGVGPSKGTVLSFSLKGFGKNACNWGKRSIGKCIAGVCAFFLSSTVRVPQCDRKKSFNYGVVSDSGSS